MKRKRGHKKGKAKGSSVSGGVSLKMESDSCLDNDNNNNNNESGMEVDTPSSTGTATDRAPYNVANINPDGSIDRDRDRTGLEKPVGRVKVKLRTPKTTVGSQLTSSDAPTHSDTDKSSPHLQMGSERHTAVAEKMEDSANSLPQFKVYTSGNLSKKAGSIKIKSSKVSGSTANQTKGDSPRHTEPKLPHQDPRFDKQELDTCLMVIKKVMKMDAAEPFNVPVNPVALGIPDYFDVIDTPMDFGTICSNLEKGVKYANSEDVFKDVQYIWDNCYKYNNKGDYILDLMRRVKKNFTKYWTAAGLYSGQPRGANALLISLMSGVDNIQENAGVSSKGKVYIKGGQSKKMARKGHGRRHKFDCLCAICVLKRRRREREENDRIAKSQTGADDNKLGRDLKQEESSLVESPSGDNSSSNMDESSVDPNEDAEVEQKGEVKKEESEQHYGSLAEKEEEEEEEDEEEGEEGDEEEDNEIEMKNEDNNERLEQQEKSREEPNCQSQLTMADKIAGIQTDTHKNDTLLGHEEGSVADQRKKHKEWRERHEKVKSEKLHFENPMLLDLCGILFPDKCKSKSIWSGPHSLVRNQSTTRASSVHAAINVLMK
ncbi:uncharacterized protein LOC107412569 isoform X1 [Ziziphus jujuba]|uniref:Uncharacterized protein LOC107412569 isoform X1 n=1 Tax=Ziziphus jujuba TaxID=326968 RepID=A0ABM3ZU26_ZIZJJ|nr:uncharacterized protein LOC107412569 isoform X1 [Ziziphus jujuba]XP_060667980.1 uncharacterized protein LOC107412569 isoform X1 [Ziziphus jujuba]